MQNAKKTLTKNGAASIFMVVFSILLFTIVVVAFTRIIMQGSQTAIENELSQSAYDSANAGVEDAKRALNKYVSSCGQCGNNCSDECKQITKSFVGNDPDNLEGDCKIVQRILSADLLSSESQIQPGVTNPNDSNSDQAYTCVKITYDTDDYIAKVNDLQDEVIVPLRPVAGGVRYLEVNWFSKDDIGDTDLVDLLSSAEAGKLVEASEWPNNRPPILLTNFFKLSQAVNYDIDSNQPATWTALLVPASDAALNEINIGSLDFRRSVSDKNFTQSAYDVPLAAVACKSNINQAVYACQAKILLPEEIPALSENHFLRLGKRYFSKASFQVRMLDATNNSIKFSGVQPIVDSNGRANDFFRRIEARVEFGVIDSNTLPLPGIGVDISKGNFCKLSNPDECD